ncbi:MAG TPA: hypothetical protein VNL77_08135 [Roseiflexaceae bacterium]|nr:hypothetical protein [Roseiflexaceae bacterium]
MTQAVEHVARRGRWRPHALALGVYALLALIVTYPMPLHLTRSIIGNQPGAVDGFLGIWNLWWAARAITHLEDPFFTRLLFHPQGLDLFWQTLSLPQGLLALPVTLALGPLPAYNLLILASFVLGGYTAFLFVRRFVGDAPAALVGGAIYALTPFHMQKVLDAQLEVASIQWVPLYLLALHTLLERRPSRRALWAPLAAGLLLLWVGLGTWYYGLFCLVYTGMAAALFAFNVQRSTFDVRAFAWGLSPLLVWLTLMAPRLAGLAASGDRLLGDARQFNEHSSADLVAFFLPSPLHPLWGAAVSDFYTRLHPTAMLWNVSLGLVACSLALVSLPLALRSRRAPFGLWRWWALLGATLLLAMGEELRVLGHHTGLPLPYALLADLPGIRSSHRPNHFVILSILLVALLAAHGFARLFPSPKSTMGTQAEGIPDRRVLRGSNARRWGWAASVMALVLLVDGWAGPLPLVTRPIPPGYAHLPSPDGGALLPIPVNLNVSRSENLWYQTAHGWPIVGGFIGREPPYPLGRYAPGVRELRYGRRDSPDILWPAWPELARESLAHYGIRYVLYHPDAMRQSLGPLRALAAELGLAPSYADARLEIYPVPPVHSPRPLAYLGAGWGGVERDGERAWRWMGPQAELYLVNPHPEPRVVRLELQMESFEHARPLSLRLGDGPPATIQVSRAAMRRTLSLLLRPGTHVVYLGAPADPRPGRGAEQISISFERIAVR